MIKVLKPGIFSSIQDLGRIGYREFGVPVSGVMDHNSAILANMLLANNENDAVLEITVTGPKLQFCTNTYICITGADIMPKLNQKPVKLNQVISVREGYILSFGELNFGCRAYLGVSGGFQTEKVMNSRSFYLNITKKSRIEAGDMLQINKDSRAKHHNYATLKPSVNLFSGKTLKVFEGPEFDLLTGELQEVLFKKEFTISTLNNRMGYQIEDIFKNNLPHILTSPVLPGTVQLTPSGRLIVLMRDGQTTGGYPRVLQLNELAINVLAQKKAGDSIQFNLI